MCITSNGFNAFSCETYKNGYLSAAMAGLDQHPTSRKKERRERIETYTNEN